MMISFKYNDVSISMDEDNGKFSMEGRFDSYDWPTIKRRIDRAAKAKYTPVTAIYTGGYRESPGVVTVTRPVIGSTDRVWIVHENKKRETVNIRDLIAIENKNEYLALRGQWEVLEAQQQEINRAIGELARAPLPERIGKDED